MTTMMNTTTTTIIMTTMMTITRVATTTTTTMTTTKEQQELFRKAVRARSLIDPLGAMGFRTQSQRARREARVRRFFFTLTTVGFAGILGVIIATTPAEPTGALTERVAAQNQSGQTARVNSSAPRPNSDQPPDTRTRGS
jgi:hypothetical protein